MHRFDILSNLHHIDLSYYCLHWMGFECYLGEFYFYYFMDVAFVHQSIIISSCHFFKVLKQLQFGKKKKRQKIIFFIALPLEHHLILFFSNELFHFPYIYHTLVQENHQNIETFNEHASFPVINLWFLCC